MDDKEQLYNAVMIKLIDSGEKEKLKQAIRTKLSGHFHGNLTERAKGMYWYFFCFVFGR